MSKRVTGIGSGKRLQTSANDVGARIGQLIRAGKPPAQAVAIALREARAQWRKQHPKGKMPAHLREPKRQANPNGELAGRKAYDAFHGAAPDGARMVSVPTPPLTVWELGRVLAVAYEATVDGKRIKFEHPFKAGSAPYLAVSPNGRALFFAGGKYLVTDRGIEDR